MNKDCVEDKIVFTAIYQPTSTPPRTAGEERHFHGIMVKNIHRPLSASSTWKATGWVISQTKRMTPSRRNT